jgi:hypothetical protein
LLCLFDEFLRTIWRRCVVCGLLVAWFEIDVICSIFKLGKLFAKMIHDTIIKPTRPKLQIDSALGFELRARRYSQMQTLSQNKAQKALEELQ